MEIGTSENFSHGQIGSNSQNYGGSAGSSSIHNGNNFACLGKAFKVTCEAWWEFKEVLIWQVFL